MKALLSIALFSFLILSSCSSNEESENNSNKKNSATEVVNPSYSFDLNEIKQRDTLKAITVFGPTSYFLYKGQRMGFDYEVLKSLANHLDVELDIVLAKDMDDMIPMLNRGEGDIILYGLTITADRKKQVTFSQPYMQSRQVLVQRKPDNWRKIPPHKSKKLLVQDVTELSNREITIRKESAYASRIAHLSDEIGSPIHVHYIDGEHSTFELIEKVQEREIDYTVADEQLAWLAAGFCPDIDYSLDVSLTQNIGWAMRNNSPDLVHVVDSLLDKAIGSAGLNMALNKYFHNRKSFTQKIESPFYSLETGQISEYDDLIKKQSEAIGWDWLLIASVIRQESEFKANAGSWAGARGLMQLMPATARELGVNNITDPEQNIQGGCKYLKQTWDRYDNIPDSLQRLKFTLASYNCGYYHVQDAIRLCKASGDNPLMWDNNVENCILKLSSPAYYNRADIHYGYVRGKEPYNYVRDIIDRHKHYEKILRQ